MTDTSYKGIRIRKATREYIRDEGIKSHRETWNDYIERCAKTTPSVLDEDSLREVINDEADAVAAGEDIDARPIDGIDNGTDHEVPGEEGGETTTLRIKAPIVEEAREAKTDRETWDDFVLRPGRTPVAMVPEARVREIVREELGGEVEA